MLFEPREARIDRSTFVVIDSVPRSIDLATRYVGKSDVADTKAIYAVDGDRSFIASCRRRTRPKEFVISKRRWLDAGEIATCYG